MAKTMLTFFNTNYLIIIWLWPIRISGNARCTICVGDSHLNCPISKLTCPVCAKVVNVSDYAFIGVKSYCDPTCRQDGCHTSTDKNIKCIRCCESKTPKCDFTNAAKLLFCFFNLAVSFIVNEGFVKSDFTKDTTTSSPESKSIVEYFIYILRKTRGHFAYHVKPDSLMTHPNGSVEFNINIDVRYHQWLFDMDNIQTDIENTITTSAANGLLTSMVKKILSFRSGNNNLAHNNSKDAPIEQEGCVKSKPKSSVLAKSNSSVLAKEDVLKKLTLIVKDVENITSSNMDPADLYDLHQSLEKIASNTSLLVQPVVDRMLSILGKVMGMDIEVLGHVVGTDSNSDRLRRLLEVLGKNVILDGKDFLSQSENIGISVKRVSKGDQPKDIYCTGFLQKTHDNKQKVEMVVSNESSELGEGYAQVEIPLKEMFQALMDEQRNMTRLTVMMLRKACFFEKADPLVSKRAFGTGNVYHVSKKINSWVVGVFAEGYNLTQLPRSFTIKFRKLNSEFDSTISMRWGADPFSDRKTWIHDGCDISNFSNTTLTCITGKLGFFTVSSQNYTRKANYRQSFHYHHRYIAMFGNAICALECLITVLTISIFVEREEKDVSKVIVLNFTASVLFSNVSTLCLTLGNLFLRDLVCELFTFFLNYTLVVSHLWAVAFALFLFLYVGYRHRYDKMFRHILQVCLATWGVPVVYTAIVFVMLHATNGFSFNSQPGCIRLELHPFIFFLPLFVPLLVLGVVLIVKTFLFSWQTTNETETQQPSVSTSSLSSPSTSTDTLMDSIADQFSACLVFFLLLNVSSMFLYFALWQNNMLVSSIYTILVVFLGTAIMVMPWNFLNYINRIKLPIIKSMRKQSNNTLEKKRSSH